MPFDVQDGPFPKRYFMSKRGTDTRPDLDDSYPTEEAWLKEYWSWPPPGTLADCRALLSVLLREVPHLVEHQHVRFADLSLGALEGFTFVRLLVDFDEHTVFEDSPMLPARFPPQGYGSHALTGWLRSGPARWLGTACAGRSQDARMPA